MVRRKKKESIQWSTLYITGREGFRKEVREVLERSDLKFMPGFAGAIQDVISDLYWFDSKLDLRSIKLAIGADLIWKYRLQFVQSAEDLQATNEPVDNGFTDREKQMIEHMQMLTGREPEAA